MPKRKKLTQLPTPPLPTPPLQPPPPEPPYPTPPTAPYPITPLSPLIPLLPQPLLLLTHEPYPLPPPLTLPLTPYEPNQKSNVPPNRSFIPKIYRNPTIPKTDDDLLIYLLSDPLSPCHGMTNTKVLNLTNKALPPTTILILSLGPQYIPKPTYDITADHRLIHDLRQYHGRADKYCSTHRDYTPPTDNTPQYTLPKSSNYIRHPVLRTIDPDANSHSSLAKTGTDTEQKQYQHNNTEALHLDLTDLHHRTNSHTYKNPYTKAIDKLLHKTIINIVRCNDLVIQMADKKVSICIQERTNYINIVLQHLSDRFTYLRVTLQDIPHLKDPEYYRTALTELLKRHHINNNMLLQFLLEWKHYKVKADPLNPLLNLPYFYGLLKLHKFMISVRPIISQSSSQLTPASDFLTQTLNPVMFGIKSYIKDADHLQCILEVEKFPPNAVLCVADITALYPNIITDDGVITLRQYLETHTTHLPTNIPFSEPYTHRTNPKLYYVKLINFICDLAYLILSHCYFHFGDVFFKQTSGVSMGIGFAPPFACIYVAQIELDTIDLIDLNLTDEPTLSTRV